MSAGRVTELDVEVRDYLVPLTVAERARRYRKRKRASKTIKGCAHARLKRFTFSDDTTIKMCPDCTRFDEKRQATLRAGTCVKASHALAVLWDARLKRDLNSDESLSVWTVAIPDGYDDTIDLIRWFVPSYWSPPRHIPNGRAGGNDGNGSGGSVLDLNLRVNQSSLRSYQSAWCYPGYGDPTKDKARTKLHAIGGRWCQCDECLTKRKSEGQP
jgi:hypothetical protein